MATERYTAEEVIKALTKAKGSKSGAARTLKCDRHTVDNYVERHPTVKQVYENLRETLVDRAEVGLGELVDAKDWPAIKFTLTTLGKDRGYTERQEISGPEGGPVAIEHELDADTIAEAIRILGNSGSCPGCGS